MPPTARDRRHHLNDAALAPVQEGRSVRLSIGSIALEGTLAIPEHAAGVVLFAHGSGSSRLSPRNRFVAGVLREAGLATLLFDLLTAEEERIDERTSELRFDIPFLAERLVGATDWIRGQPATASLAVGCFGASTGAAAALVAAARRSDVIGAVVSRGGRPDLAGDVLAKVRAPTLLIVGGDDETVLRLNRLALAGLRCEKQLAVIPGASHLFEDPGTLQAAAELARDWFAEHLASDGGRAAGVARTSPRLRR
jgi:dienelactone hydrolase